MSTKVTTGKVRFSYCNLVNPRESSDGGKAKYSVTLLIPKSDKDTLAKFKAAIQEAADKFREKNGPKSLPPKPNTTLHDGDGVRGESGEQFGEECRGCYVITVTTQKPPVIYDKFKNEIDADEVYSGCYGRAVLNFAGYKFNGKKGISAYIVSLMKLHDGEPLGGGARASAADYDDGYQDDYDEDDDLDGLL